MLIVVSVPLMLTLSHALMAIIMYIPLLTTDGHMGRMLDIRLGVIVICNSNSKDYRKQCNSNSNIIEIFGEKE